MKTDNLITKGAVALALLLVLGWTLPLAADEPPPGQFNQYFGLGAGMTTGYGLAYRYWPHVIGFQITGVPMVQRDSTWADFGLTGLFKLNDTKWTRFFAYFGLSGQYSSTPYGGTDIAENVGGGIGFEVILWDHIALDLMGGYQVHLDNLVTWQTGLTVEGGIFYRL